MQDGMTENLNPFISEGDNLDLFSSTYQLQTLLQKEIQFIHELKEYVALLHKEREIFGEKNWGGGGGAFWVFSLML